MKSKKFATFVVLGLAALIVGALASCNGQGTADAVAAAENELQTSIVRTGDIVISATGAGTVIPAEEVALSFDGSGRLAELLVAVGDEVTSGDVLARLDDSAAQEAVVTAELQLAQAILQNDASATETGVSYNDIAVEQGRLSLQEAQRALDDLLNWEPDANEIALLQAQLDAAEASYNAALGAQGQTSSNIQVQEINLEQAQRSLADAQATYDTAFDPGRDWELGDPRHSTQLENERTGAERSLQNATDNLVIAQANYNGSVSGSVSGNPASSQAGLVSAQQALSAAQDGPTETEIEAAQTAVRQAELTLMQAQLNQEADTISQQQSQLSLDSAREALSKTLILAPLDGVVTSVDATVGELVGSTAIITLADLNQPMLEVYVDETDLDKVVAGYPADIVFDAFPDETISGTIVRVDPSIDNSSGISAVRAIVQLDNSRPQVLPVGLNATVEIVGGEALGAPLVPVEALREISPGQFVVFVLQNNEPVMTPVEVGLMNFAFAEVTSGVQPGDTVTTGVVDTQ